MFGADGWLYASSVARGEKKRKSENGRYFRLGLDFRELLERSENGHYFRVAVTYGGGGGGTTLPELYGTSCTLPLCTVYF